LLIENLRLPRRYLERVKKRCLLETIILFAVSKLSSTSSRFLARVDSYDLPSYLFAEKNSALRISSQRRSKSTETTARAGRSKGTVSFLDRTLNRWARLTDDVATIKVRLHDRDPTYRPAILRSGYTIARHRNARVAKAVGKKIIEYKSAGARRSAIYSYGWE